ncbi:MAG: hypothetical protein WC861_00195 [Candidatus Micrarchaeia archaeon]
MADEKRIEIVAAPKDFFAVVCIEEDTDDGKKVMDYEIRPVLFFRWECVEEYSKVDESEYIPILLVNNRVVSEPASNEAVSFFGSYEKCKTEVAQLYANAVKEEESETVSSPSD